MMYVIKKSQLDLLKMRWAELPVTDIQHVIRTIRRERDFRERFRESRRAESMRNLLYRKRKMQHETAK